MNVLVDRASSLKKYSKMKFSVWKISHVNNASHARRGIMRANHPGSACGLTLLPLGQDSWLHTTPPPLTKTIAHSHKSKKITSQSVPGCPLIIYNFLSREKCSL